MTDKNVCPTFMPSGRGTLAHHANPASVFRFGRVLILLSLCYLRALCVSVVDGCWRLIHHRDAEDTETAGESSQLRLYLCFGSLDQTRRLS